MFSPNPFPGWAPRLLTGNSELDSGHRLLLNAIARLNEICTEFEGRKSAAAKFDREEFIDLLGDLLAYLVDHFCAEEKLMRTCGLTVKEKELCDAHIEDHAAISGTVLRIVSTLDIPQTAPLVMQLRSALQDWLEHHISIHDAVLVRLIRQS